jgi:hypothetical protein
MRAESRLLDKRLPARRGAGGAGFRQARALPHLALISSA